MRIRRNKIKKCVALCNGEVIVDDMLQAALDNHIMLDELKKRIIAENPDNEITFVYRY